MAVGDLISAARYNAMQSKVNMVLGIGSGEFGYGQPVDSSPVSLGNNVNASHMQVLKTDIIDAYVHQTGSFPTLPDIITDDDITDSAYLSYESFSNYIYTNKNDIFVATQSTTEFNRISSTRNTAWGGNAQPQSIFHEFSVTFASANARRHFFNSGGEIRFAASMTGGTGAKFTAWSNMLAAMGTLRFTHDTLVSTNGLSSNIGNFELTSTYQTLYVRGVTDNVTYSDNDYTIQGRGDQNSNVIQFRIEFNDGDTGGIGGLDEPVTGTLTSTISQLRATGIYVEVPSPTYQNITTLS
jgi:hypothetical protein